MQLTPEAKKQATLLTIDLLLYLRREMQRNGTHPYALWEQLQSRLAIASRTAAKLDLWYSTLLRGLTLQGVSSNCCNAYGLLEEFVTGAGIEREWIKEIERTLPAIIAKTRVEAEARKNWKEWKEPQTNE